MRRTHLIIAVLCVLAGVIVFLVVRGIVLSLFPSTLLQGSSQEMVKHLPLTPEQKQRYTANQGAIMLEEQSIELERLQRNRAWAHVWPFFLVTLVMSLTGAVMCFFYRRTRPVVTIAAEGNNGQHVITSIPVIGATTLERQFVAFAPVARNLALAHGDSQERTLGLWNAFVGGTRALQSGGKQDMLLRADGESYQLPENSAQNMQTPTFRQLLNQGAIAPGQPLIMGYNNGMPEHRTIEGLKALGIAGWQGSGKTWSSAYLMGSFVYCYGAKGYLLDPHRRHRESLSSRLKPLIESGFVHAVNPFHAKKLLEDLDRILDRRLAGQEPCTPAIIIMFDELSRLVKSSGDILTLIVGFLERCTEETRKANMLFVGCSSKWTARHFGGRADIRGCMNSSLVHKTKKSQAELLLEEPEEKALLKELKRPGEGVLVTDFSGPVKVAIPYCTNDDFVFLTERLLAAQGGGNGQHQQNQPDIRKVIPPQEVVMLDGQVIQQMIRGIIADPLNGLKLQDVYEQLFTPDVMKFETFRKKYQQPDERPWQPTEQRRLSEQLPLIVEQASTHG